MKMFVSYLTQLYLLPILYFWAQIVCVDSHPFVPSHCNYTIDTIDAISNFTNGSLFVASGHNYWLLKSHEKPIHENALIISDFLPEVSSVEAVVNLKTKADKQNKRCVSVDEQLMFYSQNENNSVVISIYEDNKWTVIKDVIEVDVLNAAKSINWSQPIDAFGYFEDIAVIFQGDSYTSVRCQDGEWHELRHLSLPNSFSGITGPLDSANFIKTHSALDDAYLYMFKGQNFYICPVFGSEPCNGPLNIVDDFFRFDENCGLSPKTSNANLLNWIIIGLFVAILVLILIAFCCYLLVLRSRQITFWVNRRRSKDRNVGLTYEALNGQVDINTKGVEPKVQTTNGNGVDITTEDQTNTPFIDSNGKADEDHKI